MRNKAVKLLEEIEANKLPSLPHVLVKLLQACRDENINFDSLSEIISQDASLTTKVIKAANSPVYGRARHLNSLKHTLKFLGFETIKSIAITASIKQFFSEYNNQKTHFLKDFWHHSLTCATISRSLAELMSYPYPEEAYISGLLHDIGKMMIEPGMGQEYKSFDHGIYPADKVLKHEKEALGISHPELAAVMLEKWNMPDVICDAVRYHHASTEDIQQAHILAKISHFSSLLASNKQSEDQKIIIDNGLRLFDLSESIIKRIVNEAETETRSVAASMDIDIGSMQTDEKQNKDDLKQMQLAQEVRDTALVQNSQNIINTDSSDLYKTIQQSVNLLFSINNSLFFNVDDTQQFLSIAKNQHLTDTCLFDDLKIDTNGNSVISQCLNKKQITDSFSVSNTDSLSIIDEQISHGLKTDGFICLPITSASQLHGVLLLGCNNNKATNLLKNTSLLKLFADNLSEKIQQHLSYNEKTSELSDKNCEIYMERAKKVIHETNNPLTVIRNYLQLLSKRLNEDDPAQSELSTIKQEIDRISNIIIRCKDAPDTESTNFSEIDINTLLTELIAIYKASLFATHNITSILKLDDKLKPVRLDKNSIKQIITNLLKNSIEAIKSDGEIIITTGTININGINYIELKLEDDGPGIPTEIMNDLYNPITSTKGQEHSGLGLSITKNLVERTGGSISCKTNNQGTVFSVQFPGTK